MKSSLGLKSLELSYLPRPLRPNACASNSTTPKAPSMPRINRSLPCLRRTAAWKPSMKRGTSGCTMTSRTNRSGTRSYLAVAGTHWASYAAWPLSSVAHQYSIGAQEHLGHLVLIFLPLCPWRCIHLIQGGHVSQPFSILGLDSPLHLIGLLRWMCDAWLCHFVCVSQSSHLYLTWTNLHTDWWVVLILCKDCSCYC